MPAKFWLSCRKTLLGLGGYIMIYENLGKFIGKVYCFSSYVDTAQSFPQPLSKEEELEALKKVAKGDKKARDLVITHNLRLVAHIVKKYPHTLEADDLISVGSIGLIKAVDSYKIDKGTKFSTYASRCIENEILMLIRSNKRHKGVISLSSPCPGTSDDKELELEQMLQADLTDIFDQVEQGCTVESIKRDIFKELKPMERKVIVERFGLEDGDAKTQNEVAKQLKISRSYVSRIETKAIKMIRECMPDIEPEDK